MDLVVQDRLVRLAALVLQRRLVRLAVQRPLQFHRNLAVLQNLVRLVDPVFQNRLVHQCFQLGLGNLAGLATLAFQSDLAGLVQEL